MQKEIFVTIFSRKSRENLLVPLPYFSTQLTPQPMVVGVRVIFLDSVVGIKVGAQPLEIP